MTKIKDNELEEMHVNIQKLKGNWSLFKGFLESKVNRLQEVKKKHETEVNFYKKHQEFIE